MICIGPFDRLKTKTSSGHEKVSNKLLKSIPISHYGFILQTFNELLIENTYPAALETVKDDPCYRKKNQRSSHVHQTRPISLLPCLGKVYERCFLVYILQMDERQCRSSTRTIGFSRAPLNDNEIRAVSSAHQHWSSTMNRFSRHLRGFHQGIRSTVA